MKKLLPLLLVVAGLAQAQVKPYPTPSGALPTAVSAPANGDCLVYNGTFWVNGACGGGVTSVGLSSSGSLVITGSPISSSGTLTANLAPSFTVSNIGTTAALTKSGASLAATQFGLLQQMTNGGSPTSIDNSYVDLLKVTDNQDSTGNGDPGRSGGTYIDYAFGSGAKGGKQAFAASLTGVADADAGIASRSYVGITSYVNPVANGGTNGNTEGFWYGGNENIHVPSGSNQYIKAAVGWEDDIANGDATTDSVIGHSIIFPTTHIQRAVKENDGLIIAGGGSIAGGNAGLDCGICIGSYTGFWPMDANGSVFSDWANANLTGIGANVGTVKNLLYFPSLNITGYAISTPGFTVDGSGNVAAASYAGLGGGKFPFILAQGGVPFILPGSATMGNNGALSAVAALAGTVPNAYVFAYPGTLGNATATSVAITGTTGQFSCTCTGLAVGQLMTISGTLGGTGTISGYAGGPTTYYVSATDGTSVFTLQLLARGTINTTAGTPTGLTYAAGGGWYFGQGSSTTAYTLYNNLYVSGTPLIPGSPTAFVTTGVGAYTANVTIAIPGPLYTLPAHAMGVNGSLDANMYFKFNNSAGTKTVAMLLGSAQTIMSAGPAALTSIALMGHVMNLGVENVQNGWQQQINSAQAVTLVENANQNTNTANAQNVWIKFTLASAADVVELQSYSVEVRPN